MVLGQHDYGVKDFTSKRRRLALRPLTDTFPVH